MVGVLITRIARDALRSAIDENGGDDDSLLTTAESLNATESLSEVRQPLIVRVDALSNGTDGPLAPVHQRLDSVL